MSARAALVVLAFALGIAALLYYRPGPVQSDATIASSAPSVAPRSREPAVPGSTAPNDFTIATSEQSDLAETLNAQNRDIHSDLQVVALILETFRSNFPQQGNPTGTNAEITAALAGKNALHLALIPGHHPAINVRGELCDRWGHPFFFHQLSGTQMEIRSAGPDRTFWTDDDIVLSP